MKKRIPVFLCLLLLVSALMCACGTQVYTVDTTGLTHLTASGDASIQEKQSYSGKLTPDNYYELPEAITVAIGGTPLESGYAYDRQTGEFSIDAASITGNIAISAVANESIVGTWETTMDITDILTQTLLDTEPGAAAYFKFSDLSIGIVFTFNNDGTCACEVDKASVAEIEKSLIKSLREGTRAMLTDLFKAQGMTVNLDEYLASNGTSFDAMFNDAFGELDMDELFVDFNDSGTYQIRDGLLYLDGTDEEATKYEIVDGTLTMSPVGEENIGDGFGSLLPLVFTRVK